MKSSYKKKKIKKPRIRSKISPPSRPMDDSSYKRGKSKKILRREIEEYHREKDD